MFGSLFSGIGGIDLGLERAGMTCAWQVEIDDYCNRVLEKHWPNVPRFRDVRAVDGSNLPPVDLIAGGFPCQDVSNAGKRVGIDGDRSGLWSEFIRIVREVRPRFVLVENVSALLARGFGRVLGELAASGYDAEWDCLPASSFGAHHKRDRIFLVAWDASNADGIPLRIQPERHQWEGWRVRAAIGRDAEPLECGEIDGWKARPALCRMDDGVPGELDRLRATGNAVVPQVAEWIGRRILQAPPRPSDSREGT